MDNTSERNEFYGYTVTTVTKDYAPYAERPPFVVEGILHETMTVWYGEKGTGKSTLAAALTVALANGDPDFLGRKITRRNLSVGVIAGDFGDDKAYGAQIALGLEGAVNASVYGLDRPPDRKVWEGLQLAARERNHGLVIVDNLTSFVDGSLRDDMPVNAFYDNLDRLVRDGRAVLLIAHSSEKAGEHGESRYPMGSSVIRARARWLCFVERYKGNTRLSFEGNYGPPHEVIVTPPKGLPHFDMLKVADADELAERRTKRQRQRENKTRAKADQIREFVLDECQGLNGKQTAEKIKAAGFQGEVSMHQSRLSEGAYGVKAITQGVWQSAAEAA